MNTPNSRHSIQEKKRQNIHKCHTFCPILGRIMTPKMFMFKTLECIKRIKIIDGIKVVSEQILKLV